MINTTLMNDKKHNIYSVIILLLIITAKTYGQVGIGTVSPQGMLDINDSSYGIIFPSVALTGYNSQTPVINPKEGVTALAIGTAVYNTSLTTNGTNDVSPGIYAWNGSRWVAQFNRIDNEKFEQTGAPFRTTIREINPNPNPNEADDVPGLTNQTFTPEYSGFYRVEIHVNLAAGELDEFQTDDPISVATMEGSFFFSMNGTGVNIDPNSALYSNDEGWFYVHPYGIYNTTRTPNVASDIIHYVSGVYYLYLQAENDYAFNMSNCIYTGDAYFVDNGDTGTGQGYIGKEIPCSVEFAFMND
jgi:hypothetical protein